MATAFYSECPIYNIDVGCHLYNDAARTSPADAGYYSDSVLTYRITGATGEIISITACSVGGGGGCNDCSCFVAGTLIDTVNGTDVIENIKVDDIVMSYNVKTNQIEPNKVLELSERTTNNLIKYTFQNGTTLISTKDHPFYVNGYKIASYDPEKTFKDYKLESELIKINDTVNLSTNETTTIINIQEHIEDNKVYTFVVKNNHNYYANGILVHNKRNTPVCCCKPGHALKETYKVDGCCCLGAGYTEVGYSPCTGNC